MTHRENWLLVFLIFDSYKNLGLAILATHSVESHGSVGLPASKPFETEWKIYNKINLSENFKFDSSLILSYVTNSKL